MQKNLKVGDEVIVTIEGAKNVGFRDDLTKIYTIEAMDEFNNDICRLYFINSDQCAHSNGVVLATELMKALM
jgi:hypothetical protein